ncbi:protein of unknown function [Nitrospira japonica]|uniref:Uncharacterized protein n=1 Tax=Nitrospira japonica TaxID=1325564 RepID=A0A1W1I7A7_9BACT|nr:hypothetical protein [Nitrospira japonica]SLM48693.1 protein of unknown function [Nitrospira japonica]
MPDTDFHPDKDSEELARKLASIGVEDIRRSGEPSYASDALPVFLEMHARELGIEAPMRDVAYVMQEFAWQWGLGREFGRMPCVRIASGEQSEIVPLSLPFDFPFPRGVRPWPWLRRLYPFPPGFLFEAYEDFLRSRGDSEGISIESVDYVLERLRNGLASFLAYRIAGFRDWAMGKEKGGQGNLGGKGGKRARGKGGGGQGGSGSGGPLPPASLSSGGGMGVEMWCTSPGLTIEFSHAYFIHFLNFGAPSFPVSNTLLGGRYVFQGKGPTYPSGTVRSQVFRIPPDYKAVTTYF